MPHFGNYNPASFGWAPNADIVPFEYRGATFAQGVARRAVPIFQGLIDDLIGAGYKLRTGGSMDTGNWGYTYKTVTGGGSSLSFHAYGLALDFDAPHNPQHALDLPGTLPPNTSAIARKWGCEWGGDWSVADRDRMHIEFHGEPGEVPGIVAANGGSKGGGTTDTTPPKPKEWDEMASQAEIRAAAQAGAAAEIAKLGDVLTTSDVGRIADAAAQRTIAEFGRKAEGTLHGAKDNEDRVDRATDWLDDRIEKGVAAALRKAGIGK